MVKKDKIIQCDHCDEWLHPDCAGLDKTECVQLSKSEETWICQNATKRTI